MVLNCFLNSLADVCGRFHAGLEIALMEANTDVKEDCALTERRITSGALKWQQRSVYTVNIQSVHTSSV